MVSPDEVLEFWFGVLSGPDDVAPHKGSIWFGGGPELDAEITARFQAAVERAGHGGLREWESSARGRLAKLLLLDQFTRNIWRGSHLAFQFDHEALRLGLDMLERRQDLELWPIERVFAYLPLEHSESLPYQERCVALYEELRAAAPAGHEAMFENYAIRHHDLIARFGRYPHRNELLRRPMTEAERAYLEGGGERFGQGSSGEDEG